MRFKQQDKQVVDFNGESNSTKSFQIPQKPNVCQSTSTLSILLVSEVMCE